MKTIKVKGKPASLSASGHYIVAEFEPLRLFVHPRADKPHYCGPELDSITYDGVKYTSYEPERRFLRDCLHAAEEIIHGKALPLGGDYSHVGDELFGRSEADNIRIAEAGRGQPNTGEQANPDYKEAYVIVSTVPASPYPYHAAAVVAIDGPDTVTLEVFARSSDARQADRSASGTFAMYADTGASSFHAVWSSADVFAGTNPVTLVIGGLY
ncbi:hypothetical protein LO762_09465 [Actinocorallia sp. API 0066]|uniref:hypothetical protein n=1 Tax=Actinocorallia sp. API 0066 TaxID=2896846 RepID=UPI001E37DB1D|nr:hypothetical protein [Actinocorallia sp. API 0066]MCD0449415.1 hypothetical protein [Actinocorallia sp. API 0066]